MAKLHELCTPDSPLSGVRYFKVVGLWHFDWSSILHQVTEKVMANKDTEVVVTDQIESLGNDNFGANEEIQQLRQQMIEMHQAWVNGLRPPPVPTDNLEYLSSLPPTTTYSDPPNVHAFAAPPPPEAPTFDVHPQVVPPYSTREPALNITGDQRYASESTFKLTGLYGDTQLPEVRLHIEMPIMTEEQKKMNIKLRSLELAIKNFQGLGEYKSVSYKDLCMGCGGKEELLMAYLGESLLGLASEWFVDENINKWISWDDLANEFLQQFQYNVELIPDEKSRTNMKKKNTKSFREYAIRWHEQAASVKPPMKPFIEVLKKGEMIEDGIKTGRIMNFSTLKVTTQEIQKVE
ncbi:hypothetical protein P3S68_003397 [Capsicum galapagoense]